MEATGPTNTGVKMRRGIAALGVFAAVTALAACNNGTTNSSSSSDNSGDAAATLTIWADDTRFSQVESFAEDFTTSTGVKVNVVQKSESDMDTEFTTQVPTGNGPDLIVMAHDKLGAPSRPSPTTARPTAFPTPLSPSPWCATMRSPRTPPPPTMT